MNIFFYSNIEYTNNAIGITKKVKGQVSALRSLGNNVLYSCYYDNRFAVMDNNDHICAYKNNIFSKTRLNHASRRFGLISFVTDYIKHHTFDIVYMRYHYFDKYTLNLIKAAKRAGAKVIMEMHSYPCLGGDRLLDKVFSKLEMVYQQKCTEEIDLFANMSQDLLPFGKPEVHIRNTFDASEITLREPQLSKNTFRLLSVAYERPAHGFDRLINGISRYYSEVGSENIEVIFAGKYMESTKNLVSKLGLEERCRFIAPVSGKDLDLLYNTSNIAVGHLANHRINSFSGSAIKTQEFLAKGIPFIYAWNEEMLSDDYPYAFKIKLNEEPVDVKAMISWYSGLEDPKVVGTNMRAFFEQSSGWVNQMKSVIDYVEENDAV